VPEEEELEEEPVPDTQHYQLQTSPAELVSLLARPVLAEVQRANAFLSPDPNGPTFSVDGVSFELALPVSRADVVAQALEAVDRCWRLAVSLTALPTTVPPATVDKISADPQEAALVVVSAQVGSLDVVLKPLRSAQKSLVENRAVAALAIVIAIGQGPPTVEWYLDHFRNDGAMCAQSQLAHPPAPRDQWLSERSFQLPDGTSLTGKAVSDNGAYVVGRVPARHPFHRRTSPHNNHADGRVRRMTGSARPEVCSGPSHVSAESAPSA